MLTLTKKSDYAIIALCHMAQDPERIVTAREIAEQHRVPQALLMNLLKTMSQREIVRSVRGARGGYRLAVPAERLRLTEIITAIEGPIRFVQCAGDHSKETSHRCDLLDCCSVRQPVLKIHERLIQFLDSVTLADIAFDHENSSGSVSISVNGAAVMGDRNHWGDASPPAIGGVDV